jgi:ATP-dependent RNA helicase RhlE
VRVAVAPVATTAEKVAQRVIHANRQDKRRVLAELLRGEGVGRALIFSRTKHGADRIVNQLDQDGISANAIHGNKSQNAREAALAAFRDGRAPVMVATDIAARGIDVDGVTHVIQFDLPEVPETYVHRIGRTARAGAAGIAIALCSGEDRDKLRAIEKLIRVAIPAEDRRTGEAEEAAPARPPRQPRQQRAAQKPRQAQEQQRPRRPSSGPARSGGGGGEASRRRAGSAPGSGQFGRLPR